MNDHEKPGRAQDPVEEASGDSFPASDPPAWTASRAGKPEGQASRTARHAADTPPHQHCEVVGLFRSQSEANPAADALLASGFNLVEFGPPRSRGRLGAGLGAPRSDAARSAAVCAALGAVAATAMAALFLPRGARNVLTAAAGGAVGAAAGHAAVRMAEQRAADPSWPPEAVLLRVRLKSADDQKRAVAILEAHGARRLHLSWQTDC